MPSKVVKVPQIMQMEALECGAACLTMILAYYGRWVPLEQVRTDCGVSRDGSKAVNILKAARSYGLDAKGMTFSTRGLMDASPVPCILFWNFNHFVVLDGFKGQYAYLNDPALGQIRVSLDEFESSFTGIALVFAPTEAFEQGGEKPDMLAYMRSRLKGMSGAIWFVMLTAAITSFVGALATSLNTVFLDSILAQNDTGWLKTLVTVMLLLGVVLGIVSILNAIYLAKIQGKMAVVSSSRFMRHLLHLPVEFYSQRMVGDIQQRQQDNESIAFVMIGQLAPVLVNTIMLVLYLVFMVNYSILLTCVGLATAIINSFLGRYISKRRMNIARSAVAASGKLYATTVGGVEMIETIKAAGAESGYFERWAGFGAAGNEAQVSVTRLNEYLGMVPVLLGQLANIMILVLGIYLIIEHDFTPGALLAFQGYLGAFMAPVSQMISLGQTLQEMQTQVERIEDVMSYEVDVPEEPVEQTAELEHEKLGGRVDLTGVSFGYSRLEPPFIENFDLHMEPGKWVALVGGSGSGKSTVAKLISGLYQPWSGQIEFDGRPVKDIPRNVFRGSLAVVDQDIVTFDDTVSNNVKLWDGSIEDYEIILACRDAGIHEEISSREGGYQSPIMPGGSNFSGGQLQRLEIARVLAQDPTIIILDEATSALDAQTEAEVIKHIRDRDISCIVVAHRLSTIRDCDEIIVLDHGKVVERGTHEKLLAQDGRYSELVRSD